MKRFTIDGSEELETRIAGELDRIALAAIEAVGSEKLRAIVLGGGYGKGEGAVSSQGGVDHTYNDYDLFLIVPQMGRRQRKEIHKVLSKLGHVLAKEVGIDVDFGPPVCESELPQMPYTQMWMELKHGHCVIWGPKSILDTLPDWDTVRPPLEEGTRLLLNRGAGLLLARRRLMDPIDDEGISFCVRNVNKAWLAMGDVLLFACQDYHPGYVERGLRLKKLDLSQFDEGEHLRERYARALEFKLRPNVSVPPEGLKSMVQEAIYWYGQIFLWYEAQRLGAKDLTVPAYAQRSERLVVSTFLEGMKNLARNGLRFGPKIIFQPLRAWHHPRDYLLGRLPALLAGHSLGAEDDFLQSWSTVT